MKILLKIKFQKQYILLKYRAPERCDLVTSAGKRGSGWTYKGSGE